MPPRDKQTRHAEIKLETAAGQVSDRISELEQRIEVLEAELLSVYRRLFRNEGGLQGLAGLYTDRPFYGEAKEGYDHP